MTEKKETTKKEVVKDKDTKAAVANKSAYLYAIGRRKRASATVRVYKRGKGKVTVNEKPLADYFSITEQQVVTDTLTTIGQADKLDIVARVKGGGSRGQAEAIRHGIARALIQLNPVFKKALKKVGYLTRDSREKERKKPGLKKARRAPQFSKR